MERPEVTQIIDEKLKELRLDSLSEMFNREHNPLDGTHKLNVGEYVKWADIMEKPNSFGVPYVDIREFGAKGDGRDDTAAIQKAIYEAKKIYIPGGYNFVASKLTFQTGTHICGDGWKSRLKHRSNSTDHLINLSGVDVYGVMISDLFIDGNKLNQSKNVDVIHFDNTGGSFDYWDDPLHSLSNVFIYQPKRDGIHFAGGATNTQGCYLSNVQVYQAGRYGFYLNGADNSYIACTAGNCDNHGFYINEGSSVFIACMGYGSGLDAVASVDGFYVIGTNMRMIGCQGQENKRHGIHLYGGGGHILVGCLTDNDVDTGLVLANATQYNTITGHHSADNTVASIDVAAGCIFNKIQAMIGDPLVIADANNAIEINNQEGYRTIDYAATISPDPYLGARIHVAAMTGNIAINATTNHYAGLRMSFEFLQDGVGGRTITFNAQYKTTWTPSKTAGKYDCIEFRHDGTNWIEINSTVGVG